jgi:hypothetical protein
LFQFLTNPDSQCFPRHIHPPKHPTWWPRVSRDTSHGNCAENPFFCSGGNLFWPWFPVKISL